MEWYLKKSDGEVFGPVAESELKEWAAEGRISPDDLLSTDQDAWQPAPGVPGLNMDWVVELPDSQHYGPLHLMAMVELVQHGFLPADASIEHKSTGERHVLSEALLSAMISRAESLEGIIAGMKTPAAPAGKGGAEVDQVLTELSAQCDALKEELATEQEKRQHAEAQVAELETQRTASPPPDDVPDEGNAVAELEAANEKLAAELEAASEKLAAEAAGADAAREQHATLQETIDQLRAKESQLQSSLEQARSEAQQAGQADDDREALKARIAEVEKERDEALARRPEPKPASTLADPEDGDADTRVDLAAVARAAEAAGDSARVGQWKDLAVRNDTLQRELTKWKKMYDDERSSAEAMEAKLTARIDELRRNEGVVNSEMDNLARRLQLTERNYEEVVVASRLAEADDPEAAARSQLMALIESHNELSQLYDTLFVQLQDKNEQIETLTRIAKEAERNADQRVSDMEKRLVQEQELADKARAQFTEIESTHHDLVKAYRDMNDRFILFRQQGEAADATSTKPSSQGPRIRLTR